jgi:hypothetical protein
MKQRKETGLGLLLQFLFGIIGLIALFSGILYSIPKG